MQGIGSIGSLFSRSQQNDSIPSLTTPNATESAMSIKKITIGGIENTGTSCGISVLLQEFASLPSYYDYYLVTPLQQRTDESSSLFAKRNEFQECLKQCVNDVRDGTGVKRHQISQLSLLLSQLGWKVKRSVRHLFLKTPNPQEIYDKILAVFTGFSSDQKEFSEYPPKSLGDSYDIALLGREPLSSFDQVINESSVINSNSTNILCRIAEIKLGGTLLCPDAFELGKRKFTLKLLHVYQSSYTTKHVIIYRKEEGLWFCCNDENIYRVDSLPLNHIYIAVYDSHIAP